MSLLYSGIHLTLLYPSSVRQNDQLPEVDVMLNGVALADMTGQSNKCGLL